MIIFFSFYLNPEFMKQCSESNAADNTERERESTTKKTKISEGYLMRENVKSLSNSVTKFYDQGICEEFYFFRH